MKNLIKIILTIAIIFTSTPTQASKYKNPNYYFGTGLSYIYSTDHHKDYKFSADDTYQFTLDFTKKFAKNKYLYFSASYRHFNYDYDKHESFDKMDISSIKITAELLSILNKFNSTSVFGSAGLSVGLQNRTKDLIGKLDPEDDFNLRIGFCASAGLIIPLSPDFDLVPKIGVNLFFFNPHDPHMFTLILGAGIRYGL